MAWSPPAHNAGIVWVSAPGDYATFNSNHTPDGTGLADVERDLIRTRTAEGRSRAQKRGQRMGRKPKLTEAQQAEARKRRAEGATLAELARSYGVGKSTISRLAA
ncbi:MAG TPA: recombinase family protein [Bradyrhizobium sp.]|nr:recombinase family protein [Bradyrhizobium sp.]